MQYFPFVLFHFCSVNCPVTFSNREVSQEFSDPWSQVLILWFRPIQQCTKNHPLLQPGSDCSEEHCYADTASKALCPFWGSPAWEKWAADCWRNWSTWYWGDVHIAGLAQAREKSDEGKSSSFLQLHNWSGGEERARLFLAAYHGWTKGNGHNPGHKTFHKQIPICFQILEQIFQRGCGTSNLENTKKATGQSHEQPALTQPALYKTLDLQSPGVPSNLSNSVSQTAAGGQDFLKASRGYTSSQQYLYLHYSSHLPVHFSFSLAGMNANGTVKWPRLKRGFFVK